ncbi:MAG TPA: hypothetical protein VL100_12310 [Croceibacterium sp.]|nr:hypothetical protein [Croceibacterium sp.]
MRHDAPLAGLLGARRRRHHLVAIGEAAGGAPGAGATELAPPDLVAQVRELHLRHRAHDADMHRGHRTDTATDRMNLDPREGQAIMEVRDVGQLAAEAVNRFADHHIDAARLGIGQQSLETRASAAGAADRGVVIHFRDCPALALGIATADLDLIGDRGGALVLGGVAGIDGNAR